MSTPDIDFGVFFTAKSGAECKITGDLAAVERITAILAARGVQFNEEIETWDEGFYDSTPKKPHAKPGTNRDLIDELRRLCTMERFSVGFPNDKLQVDMLHEPSREEHPDHFIKEQTRQWRECWLLPLVDQIEARLCKAAA